VPEQATIGQIFGVVGEPRGREWLVTKPTIFDKMMVMTESARQWLLSN
jgi:hypothetical protein